MGDFTAVQHVALVIVIAFALVFTVAALADSILEVRCARWRSRFERWADLAFWTAGTVASVWLLWVALVALYRAP